MLFLELKNAFSSTFIKKTLAGASFVLGIFFGNVAQAQSFEPATISPFGIPSIYAMSKCAVNDFDSDGDYDIMLITVADTTRHFTYMNNSGTASNPIFTNAQNSPFSLGQIDETLDGSDGSFGTPVAVDIDNDGDLDLMTGKGFDYYTTTRLIFTENIGTSTNPIFGPLQTDPFGINFPNPYTIFTVPAFVDIDNDGDQDLFVGHYYGTLKYFENIGTPSSPNFAAEAENPFNITTDGYLGFPTFSDLDGDGDQDLVLGTQGSNDFVFKYYENTGTAAAANFATAVENPFGLDQGTGYTIPSNFADMDDDGDQDLFTIFIYDNGVEYFENTSAPGAGIIEYKPNFETSVYPSPTNDLINIDLKGNTADFSKIEILDLSGKVVLTVDHLVKEISIKSLDGGIYTLKVSTKSGKSTQTKIQKI